MAVASPSLLSVSSHSKSIDINQVEAELKAIPWPEDHKYGAECCCKAYIVGETPMKYIQPEKSKSFKPTQQYYKPSDSFPTDTVYRKSYKPIDLCNIERSGPPPSSLRTFGPFPKDTTHRMSYGPVPLPEPQPRYYPQHYNLNPCGPMADVTTQRHDFPAKSVQPPKPFKYMENIGLPDVPMENRTTNRLSYGPIDCTERSVSYRPRSEPLSCEPFPKDTIYRMSYQPTEPQPRDPKCKPSPYHPPVIPMDALTVYKRSFLPPGHFVKMECPPAEDETQGCYCVYPGECMVEKYKKAHDFTSENRRNEKKEKEAAKKKKR